MADSSAVRPRIEGERMREILDAVIDVLLEVGYDKLTFDMVSAQAHASKATLYRKWPSKADLVLAALNDSSACTATALPHWDTGSLTADLEAMTSWAKAKPQNMPDVIGAVASALPRDEALREGFWATFSQPRIAIFREVLERAQRRGEVRADADLDLLALIVPSFALHYTLQHGHGPDADYFTRVIDGVLLPAITPAHPAA